VTGIDPADADGVFLRTIAVCLVLAAATASFAAHPVEVYASCATELARDPSHLRTLRGELAQALAGISSTASYKLDVSLVRLGSTAVGSELEVRAEIRALLSDARGKVHWTSTSSSLARGHAGDRARLQRDAVAAGARDLAKSVRDKCCARRKP
jgi:hypothetical protein